MSIIYQRLLALAGGWLLAMLGALAFLYGFHSNLSMGFVAAFIIALIAISAGCYLMRHARYMRGLDQDLPTGRLDYLINLAGRQKRLVVRILRYIGATFTILSMALIMLYHMFWPVVPLVVLGFLSVLPSSLLALVDREKEKRQEYDHFNQFMAKHLETLRAKRQDVIGQDAYGNKLNEAFIHGPEGVLYFVDRMLYPEFDDKQLSLLIDALGYDILDDDVKCEAVREFLSEEIVKRVEAEDK